MTFQLFACTCMSTSISKEQCRKNKARRDIVSCVGCPDVSANPVGEVVLTVPPAEELAKAETPTVVLRFKEPEDRELYNVLKGVCSDLEYDLISLLHLACRVDLKKLARTKPMRRAAA